MPTATYGATALPRDAYQFRDTDVISPDDPEAGPQHLEYEDVEKLDELLERIRDAETVHEWSLLLKDHVWFGNSKIADSVGIFNLNAAHDCPNLESSNCQVPADKCYAVKMENFRHESVKPHHNCQEVLWDHMDAITFAEAFRKVVERRRKPTTALRFSEAGDFRYPGDVYKAERIARELDDLVDVYTYSASDYLPWEYCEAMTVNQSNDNREYGDQRFRAVPTEEDVPDDGVLCAYDSTDGDLKCGDCRCCIDKHGRDIYVTMH